MRKTTKSIIGMGKYFGGSRGSEPRKTAARTLQKMGHVERIKHHLSYSGATVADYRRSNKRAK